MTLHSVPTGEQAVIYLAEALGRERALSEPESRILERAIRAERPCRRAWSPGDDRALMKMHKAKRGAVEMAKVLKRSEMACYKRLHQLKKLARVKRHG